MADAGTHAIFLAEVANAAAQSGAPLQALCLFNEASTGRAISRPAAPTSSPTPA
jgi:hypothetical protein